MQKARKKEEAVSSVLFEQHGMRQSLIITEQEEKVFKRSRAYSCSRSETGFSFFFFFKLRTLRA